MDLFEDKSIVQDEQNKPIVYQQCIDKLGRASATGRRKTSVARVWISRGTGKFTVNSSEVTRYFDHHTDHDALKKPFNSVAMLGKFDVFSTVKGGGTTGQVGALILGIARALQNYNPDYRPALKVEGLLTRDSRKVERKKYGRKKARKSFQFSKR